MNRLAFAISILELNLDEWEPIRQKDLFIIKHRKTNQQIGHAKSLVTAILKARDFEMEKLNRKK
jgi:hypothetical protein